MVKKQLLWLSALAAGLFSCPPAIAQQAGQVIPGYGNFYHVENPDIPPKTDIEFKVVFDVYNSPAPTGEANPHLETAARFLNLHLESGIPAGKLHVALVVHGKATEDLLMPEAYREKHGAMSPNAQLIKALLDAGVKIAVCGQSASSRGISKEETIPGVQWALSAMTALVYYQNEGYQFIKF
jgi:intracellular sulfur oxidation DsrE/DsrF family protein